MAIVFQNTSQVSAGKKNQCTWKPDREKADRHPFASVGRARASSLAMVSHTPQARPEPISHHQAQSNSDIPSHNRHARHHRRSRLHFRTKSKRRGL
ncbi:hypothetical protein Nepgr_029328 [Nepenthes gracilis]|uniref:Uncharacterized protein n=1 Tax=Nepenthes gracilis TaxID=150966 RepID=A0AAD3TC98_NEPGR|nr:hypothetical protein Nepgr_029328 [Nepenthes gracilis]